MNRRNFIIAAPLLASGCAGMTVDSTISAVSKDVSILAAGLQGAIAQLGSLSIPATVGVALSGLQSVADAIASVSSQTAAQPLVQKVESYVNIIVAALSALPLPSPVTLALQAASILLPIIEAAVGMVLPAGKAKLGSAMSPDEARLVLKGAAAKL